MKRRHFLSGAALPLLGCKQANDIAGGFTGINHNRGHLLQTPATWPAPSVTRSTEVLICGGGVAGLAAARALRLKGVEDFALLELEDEAGGNSRGGLTGGLACPLGAHYLPLPSDAAPEVQDLLEELDLRERMAGRWVYDERHLCHSPQERLYFNGAWQEGLLPVNGVGPATLAQYQKFANLIAQLRQQVRWTIPASKSPLAHIQRALIAITFISYLDQNGLTDPHLRWYLNYCCRDDYGMGIASVSAWAGIHYFASRHGFTAPGTETSEREGLLTWPEGNAWLTRRLAAPLGQRQFTSRVVVRVANTTHGVEVDAFNTATQALERWQARSAVVALPIFVAARVVQNPPDWLVHAAKHTVYSPWLVANIHIEKPLHDPPGAPPSWDNVIYGDPTSASGLGYVDAKHQSLQPVPGATVLTHYRALGDVAPAPGTAAQAQSVAGRQLLLSQPWKAWRDVILGELSVPHPDLAAKITRIDITRYGHAMAVPVPRIDGQIGHLRTLGGAETLQKSVRIRIRHDHLSFAHSDWAGYSVFEEAFTLGHWAV